MQIAGSEKQCPALQAITERLEQPDSPVSSATCRRRSEACEDVVGLSTIYEPDVHLAVWQRKLAPELLQAAQNLVAAPHFSSISANVSAGSINELLQSSLPDCDGKQALVDDAVFLVDLFSCLFDLPRVGFRMTRLDRVMCPRFHVDHVPCRMVTTYTGAGTEWLPHASVNREKLGRGNNGLPDHISGVYRAHTDIRSLQAGDVALLKGEKWLGNEGAGLVHRSPDTGHIDKRLMLTLDFA